MSHKWSGEMSNSRRSVLRKIGAVGMLSMAGCTGGSETGDGGGGTTTGGSEFQQQVSQIGFTENWRDRRMETLDGWPLEKRKQIPELSSDSWDKAAWKNSEAVKSATWEPPAGWEDTLAADVDKIQIFNAGDMKFDPATVAVEALFEDRTGITIEPIGIPGGQLLSKQTAVLQAEEPEPALMGVGTRNLWSLVGSDFLQPLDVLYSDDAMWDQYIPATRTAFEIQGSQYLVPGVLEGQNVHVRIDLLEEQGISQSLIAKILEGDYSWDDIETVMKAFEGTGTYAWAYRGGSQIYTVRDWRTLMYQAGGQMVQDDGTVVLNGDAHVHALEKMVEWREKEWVPPAVNQFGQGDSADGFLSGQLAMVPVEGDLISSAMNEFGDNYRPVVMPRGGSDAPKPTQASGIFATGDGINVYASVAQKLAALIYLDARMSYFSGWYEMVEEGNQTHVKQVFDDAVETDATYYPGVRGRALEMGRFEQYPQIRPISTELSKQLQIAITGDKEPQAALDAVQDNADLLLEQ
jgi:multiple sugar transport system substrate-binding protein